METGEGGVLSAMNAAVPVLVEETVTPELIIIIKSVPLVLTEEMEVKN